MEAITAVMVMLALCGSSGADMTAYPTCKDGEERVETTVKLLTRDASGEDILRISQGEQRLFTLHINGTAEAKYPFNPDDLALTFWRAVAAVYRDACPSIADVLKPLQDRK